MVTGTWSDADPSERRGEACVARVTAAKYRVQNVMALGGFPGPLLMIADLQSKSPEEITRLRSLTGASNVLVTNYVTRRG